MARATLAQQTMAQVGGIRHKPVEQTVKKDDKPSETTRLASSSTKPGGPSSTNGQLKRSNTMPAATPRNGTAVTNTSTPRNGTTGTSIMRPGKGSGNTQSKDVKRNGTKAPPPEPEKKIKKAALATTGYTGTARPTTAPATKGKPADASTRAGLVNPHGSRSPKSSSASRYRRRDEDEDEELDDFIEYDDEEDEGPGPKRYEHYDSDGSSDMEAGLDDIDGEEEYAARMARREDEAEEAALRQAKLLKERRKMEFAKRRAHRAA
jgi:protein SPT2